jgi:hypothetical protein
MDADEKRARRQAVELRRGEPKEDREKRQLYEVGVMARQADCAIQKVAVQVARKPPASDCLVPACVRATEIRGLCRTCYTTARRLVLTGRATWEDLERYGKILPAPPHTVFQGTTEWLLDWKVEDPFSQAQFQRTQC